MPLNVIFFADCPASQKTYSVAKMGLKMREIGEIRKAVFVESQKLQQQVKVRKKT